MTSWRCTHGAKDLCIHLTVQASLSYRRQRGRCAQVLSFNLDCKLRRNSDGAKISCHSLISLFPFQKKEWQLILRFLQAEGRGTFMCERMAHPQPSEDSSSQEHLFALIEVCPNRVPGSGASLPMPHYSTIFIPHLSDACDSLGVLQPGKDVPWP